jgi:hypothetical protein
MIQEDGRYKMKIFYEDGPDTVSIGSYKFKKGIEQDIPDNIARKILRKQLIKFKSAEKDKNEGGK